MTATSLPSAWPGKKRARFIDEPPIGRSFFCRGSERRAHQISVGSDRRTQHRRAKDIGWIPLFRGSSIEAISEALADCDVLLLPAGTPLLRPGEENQNVYVLLSGEMAVHLDVDLHPNAGLAIRPGECIGEFSAIDGKPVSALVVAVSASRVLKLSRDLFWNRLMALPGVATNLMTGVTEAQDPDGNEFSEGRCGEHLVLAQEASIPSLLDNVRLAVTAFTRTETLADDCTMLGLRLPGTLIRSDS